MYIELGNIRYGHRTTGYKGLAFVWDQEREGTVRFASQVTRRVYETTTGWEVDETTSSLGDIRNESWICLHGDFTDIGEADYYKGIWGVPDAMRK
jgi:hypothetical protein